MPAVAEGGFKFAMHARAARIATRCQEEMKENEKSKNKKINDDLQVFGPTIKNISSDGTDHRRSIFASLEKIMALGVPRTLTSASGVSRTTTRESLPGKPRRPRSSSPCSPSQRPGRCPISMLSARFKRRCALCVQTKHIAPLKFDMAHSCSI